MSEQADKIAQQLEQVLDRLSIGAVFGEPRHEGETTLIPVAEATLGFGYGYGSAPASPPGTAEEEEAAEVATAEAAAAPKEAGGGGAGGGGKTRPLGYVQIDADGVRFVSIEDDTRIALAGIAMVAWSVFWIAMALRSRRK